ncbi:DUF3168 domain-containing protein [Streptomyces olivoreticuli]|uniref:DUF3168 domain-containing protein n=1 Tax=Streptomyces olivoreticuli TaxID=68246 RepID=UPI000E27AD03|nr:DUF3168 domain-containing protein [Streptomyces olivoreticuli]
MINRAPVTEAVRAMLSEAVGKSCGVGALPTVGGTPVLLPYLVLYPLGGDFDGALLGDRSEDAHLVYQVTVVASRTDQAEWVADRVRRALLDRAATGEWVHPLVVPGGRVWGRALIADDGTDPSSAGEGVVTYALRIRFSIGST